MQHPFLLPALCGPPNDDMRGILARHAKGNSSQQRVHSTHLKTMPQMRQGNIVLKLIEIDCSKIELKPSHYVSHTVAADN